MAAVIGALRAELSANIAKFTSDFGKASGEVGKFATKFDKMGQRISSAGNLMSIGITAPFLALVATAIPAATEAAQASGQVEAALKSMGGAAGRTKEQLDAAAEALMRTSTFDDDEILAKVTANLLTFGNVAGEQFDRAQQAAVDLATRLGTDLQSATLLVGKALNDPVKGMTALRRAGIQLTEQQQAQIKAMAAAGDAAGAQGILLGELERQFGGAAQAMRDATPGRDAKNAWDSFQEVIGGFVLKILPPLTAFLAQVLDGFNNLSPGMQQVAMIAAAVVAALGPVLSVVGAVMSGIAALTPVVVAAAGALGATGGGLAYSLGFLIGAALPVVAIIAALVAGFLLFKDKLIPVFDAFRAKVGEVLGPKFTALLSTLKASLTELWEGPLGQAIRVVIDVLGTLAAAFASVFGEVLIRVVSGAIDIIGGMFENVVNIVNLIAALFRGDWSAAWDAAVAIVRTTITTLLNVIDSLVPGATDAMRRLYDGVKRWLMDRLGAVLRWVGEKVREVGDFFYDLYDRVVGHSYIPDMVRGVAEWMAKLDAGMVRPARNATKETADAFADLARDVEGIMDGLLTETQRITRQVTQDVETMNRAIREGVIDAQTGQRVIAHIQARGMKDAMQDQADAMKQAARDAAEAMREMAEGLKDAARQAKEKAKEAAQAWGSDFADNMERIFAGDIRGVIAQMLSDYARDILRSVGEGVYKLFEQYFGFTPSVGGILTPLIKGAGSWLGNAFSGIFGGFRADGGPVMSGKSYIVGERGPELFTPGVSGGITPNGAGGGTIYIDARGAGQAELSELRSVMREFGENFKEMSWSATNEGIARGMIAPPGYAG